MCPSINAHIFGIASDRTPTASIATRELECSGLLVSTESSGMMTGEEMKSVAWLGLLPILTACGPSEEEIKNTAIITCNIIAESRKMDAAMRIKEVNSAREKLGGRPFLGRDEDIKAAIKEGLCERLVADRYPSDDELRSLRLDEAFPAWRDLETQINNTELTLFDFGGDLGVSIYAQWPAKEAFESEVDLSFEVMIDETLVVLASSVIFCEDEKPENFTGTFSPYCGANLHVNDKQLRSSETLKKYQLDPTLPKYLVPTGVLSIKTVPW